MKNHFFVIAMICLAIIQVSYAQKFQNPEENSSLDTVRPLAEQLEQERMEQNLDFEAQQDPKRALEQIKKDTAERKKLARAKLRNCIYFKADKDIPESLKKGECGKAHENVVNTFIYEKKMPIRIASPFECLGIKTENGCRTIGKGPDCENGISASLINKIEIAKNGAESNFIQVGTKKYFFSSSRPNDKINFSAECVATQTDGIKPIFPKGCVIKIFKTEAESGCECSNSGCHDFVPAPVAVKNNASDVNSNPGGVIQVLN